MSFNQLTQHSSHLWISDFSTIEEQLIQELQNCLCPQPKQDRGCRSCKTCMLIKQKTHPWIIWFSPENAYTLEQIGQVLESVQFLLDSQEKRFFIFTQAHELTPACSNQLLKTIEEPHPGYHFIFITHRSQELLPTLVSRCFVHNFKSTSSDFMFQEIIQPFIDQQFDQPIQFMKLIEKQTVKESATKEIIDLLFQVFHKKLKESIKLQDQKSQKNYLQIITILQKALLQLPIQGSYKLFWKNLYMTFHQETTCLKK